MSDVTYPLYVVRSVHIDNQFAKLTPQKCTNSSLDIYITISHWVFLHASIHKDHHEGIKLNLHRM